MSVWIKCNERMPTHADGKGRDSSVLCHLTDVPGDFSYSGTCSVSSFNVAGWVAEGKCQYWTHLPDPPSYEHDTSADQKRCTCPTGLPLSRDCQINHFARDAATDHG